MTADNPKFIVDHMLGNLARWLRMLGYDAHYDKALDDDGIAEMSSREGRFVITRDKLLSARTKGMLIVSTSLDEQLIALRDGYGLEFRRDSMRCSLCNGPLRSVAKEEIKGVVPAKSLVRSDEFWECESCRKAYWNGSHWNEIMDKFKRLHLAPEEK